jgi:hypothetical protein
MLFRDDEVSEALPAGAARFVAVLRSMLKRWHEYG